MNTSPMELAQRLLVDRLRNGAAPLDDPNLNDDAADELQRLGRMLTRTGILAAQDEHNRLRLLCIAMRDEMLRDGYSPDGELMARVCATVGDPDGA